MFVYIDNKKVEYPYQMSQLKTEFYHIPVDPYTQSIPAKVYRKYVFAIHNRSLGDLIRMSRELLPENPLAPNRSEESFAEVSMTEDPLAPIEYPSSDIESGPEDTHRKHNVSFLCEPTIIQPPKVRSYKELPSLRLPTAKKTTIHTHIPIHPRITPPHTKSTTSRLTLPTPVPKIIHATIKMPIDTLQDLIQLAKRAYIHPKNTPMDEELIQALHKTTEDACDPLPMYPISPLVKYNIDLEMLFRILPEMEDLQSMIGQTNLKVQVANLILFHAMGLDKRGEKDLLHTVIYGSPGTGKTEFAQRIAKIYLKMGVLRKNTFKKVKRSDLIAGYLGQTAIQTMEVIEEARGGVLFIDEAYSLGSSQGKEGRDSFSKECVDTLNQCLTEMRDKPEHYFILMIAGYKDDLERSFFAMNDGLERRFTIHLTMDEYKPEDMVDIFRKKVRDAGWVVAEKVVSSEFMKQNADYFKYAGGDMEVLFSKCKVAHSRNLLKGTTKTKFELSRDDLDDGFVIYKSICGRMKDGEESNAFWRSMYN